MKTLRISDYLTEFKKYELKHVISKKNHLEKLLILRTDDYFISL